MKKLLFVLFVLITGVASGQGNSVKPRTKTISIGGGYYLVQDLTPIIGYTRIFARYEWNSGAFDSTLYAPRYNGVPTGARVNENSDIDGKLAVDTANHRLYFYSGGSWRYSTAGTSGGTPTWQQTLTASPNLTQNNTIDGGGFNLIFNNLLNFQAINASTGTAALKYNGGTVGVAVENVGAIVRTGIYSPDGTRYFRVQNSATEIAGLANLSTQDRLVGIQNSTGNIGNITLGSGLSLSSGVLNTSGTVATPISSLTAATGTNSINNADYSQTWGWNSLTGVGLSLSSSSTAASAFSVGQNLLSLSLSGAHANSTVTSTTLAINNSHTGTSPTNQGISLVVSGGLNNLGIKSALNSTGNNISAQFEAIGGTTNYAIIVPASSGSVGIGTSTPTEILHVVGNIKGTNYIELTDVSAPSTPSSGFGRLYVRADSLRFKNDGGTEFTMGTGGGVTGSGTTNYLPKWTGASALGNSNVYDDGTNVGIGTTSPGKKLDVTGNGRFTYNALAADTALIVEANTTAAASNSQVGLSVRLLGANATGSQTTKSLYVENLHTGTSPVNIGAHIKGAVSGGIPLLVEGVQAEPAIDIRPYNASNPYTPELRFTPTLGVASKIYVHYGNLMIEGGYYPYGPGDDAMTVFGQSGVGNVFIKSYPYSVPASPLNWMMRIRTAEADAIGLVIDRGAASQTADLMQYRRSDGTVLARHDSIGYLGIGVVPTAKIHTEAQSTTAGSSQFKMTSSASVMTTPEAGAFEYTTPQLFFTNGSAVRQEIPQIQQARVSTQYDNTTTTLGTVTGLTTNVAAGKTYRFEAVLYTTSNVAGGVKFAMAGTATATNIIYEAVVVDANVNAAQTRATALATTVGAVTAVTNAYTKITGTITVNAAGTFLVQAAANVATGTTSVLVGSTFVITEML